MPSPRAQEILARIHRDRANLYRLLQRLVEAESPSDDAGSQEAVQEILRDGFRALRYRVRRLRGRRTGGYLLAVSEERIRRRPLQLLVGHCDTVWPRGTLQAMPVTMRAGKMTGPGIYDMKAGLAMTLTALRALREIDARPEVSPVVFVNSDEEIGSHESRPAVRRLARLADRVLVMEPAFGRRGKLKTARKGVGQFTVRIRGKASHAGLEPKKGVSAILELSHVVQKLFALNDPERGITLNVGTIDGGMRPNVVAPEGRAAVDVRVMTVEQAREIEAAIRSLRPETPGARIEVEGGFDLLPMERTSRNRALWRMAQQVAAELDLKLGECLAGGGSDGNVASLFAPTLDGLGAVGGGAHAAHEFVVLDSLVERTTLLALLLLAPPLAWRNEPAVGESRD